MKKVKSKKAFSLIELIFVIAVLGIIAAVAVPKLLDTRSSAIVSTVKQDISTISTAIQSHYMIKGEIAKITDSVNVNTKTWNVEDKNVEFIHDNESCVKIEVVDNNVNIIVDANSSTLCQELYDSGVRAVSYELF